MPLVPAVSLHDLIRDCAAQAGGYFRGDSHNGETQSGIELRIMESPIDDSIRLQAINPGRQRGNRDMFGAEYRVDSRSVMHSAADASVERMLTRVWEELIHRAERRIVTDPPLPTPKQPTQKPKVSQPRWNLWDHVVEDNPL